MNVDELSEAIHGVEGKIAALRENAADDRKRIEALEKRLAEKKLAVLPNERRPLSDCDDWRPFLQPGEGRQDE